MGSYTNFPLARQPSIYSLTFDELQNTLGLGGLGKDFGSMNMDELLKNIWTAEETQAQAMAMTASGGGGGEGSVPGGDLQRQGSLTLPRTLSQKTVDEVWRDLFKDSGGAKDGSSGGGGGSNMPQRQPTLGEMTLEEFLARAGVVREDMQQIGRPDTIGFYGDFSRQSNNTGLVLGFQQPNRNNGLLGNNNTVPNQAPSLALNVGGVRSSQQQLQQQQLQHQQLQQQQQHQQHQQQQQQQQHQQQQQQLQQLQHQHQQLQHQHQHHQLQQHQLQQPQQHQPQQPQPQQQQPLFPKQANLAFASPMHLVKTAQLAMPGARGSIVGIADPPMNNNLVQAGGLQSGGMGMVGLGTGGVTVAAGSPASQVSPDVIAKSSIDTSSLSPVPYVFGRGRKCSAALEKVVERRQRRMIKNRESAARSRARKQAYTLELEAEIAKLKELNQELQKKQADMMEMQKNQLLEKMNRQWGGKRQCLRRTLTGPW